MSDSVMPNLSRGFLNLGRSFKSLATHSGSFKENIKAAGTNFKEFFSANKVKLFVAALMVAIAAINQIKQSQENAKREQNEAADKARETAEATKQNYDELTNLIAKYKELAKSGKVDIANRREAQSIQNEIVKLVGAHEAKIDLVNGKYREQLGIITEIEKKERDRAEGEARTSLRKNRANAEAQGDSINADGLLGFTAGWAIDATRGTLNNAGIDADKIQFIMVSPGSDKGEALDRAIESINNNTDSGAMRGGSPFGVLAKGFGVTFARGEMTLSQYKEEWEKVLKAVDDANNTARKNGEKEATDTAAALYNQYNELFGTNGSYTKYLESLDFLVEQRTSNVISGIENTSDINSIQDFIDTRDKIINKLASDEDIKVELDKGTISLEEIGDTVDLQLGQLDGLSKYASDYARRISAIKTLTNSIQKRNLNFEPSDELKKWMYGLTDDEIDIVLRFSEEMEDSSVEQHLNLLSRGNYRGLSYRYTQNNDGELVRTKTGQDSIDAQAFIDAGWTTKNGKRLKPGELIEDLFPQTYTGIGSDGNPIAINLTPVLVDEDGNVTGILSPEELEKQAKGIFDGSIKDSYLQIGMTFEGKNATEDAKKAVKEIELWRKLQSEGASNDISKLSIESYEAVIKAYKESLSGIEEENSTLAKSFASIMSDKDSEGKTFAEKSETVKSEILTLQDAFNAFQTGDFGDKGYNEWLDELTKQFPELSGQSENLGSAIETLISDKATKQIADFDSKVCKLDQDTINAADSNAIDRWRTKWEELGATTQKFQSDIENLVSVFGTVKSAVEEYNENGFLSLSSLQSILSLNDKYISALTNEQGALDLSTESYKKLVEAELIELKAQTLQNSLDTVRNIDNRTKALAYLNEREHSAAQASLDLADAQWQEALSAAAVKDIQQGTGDLYQRTVIAARKAYDTRIALIDEYAKTAFTIGELSTATDEYSKALNNEKEALENSKKALEDQKNALEDTKQGYEDALSAVKDLVSWVQDYIKQIKNDEIDTLEKKKESIDKLIESQKELLDAEKEEYEWNKTIAEKQNTVAKDALAASIASLDDSSAGRKAQKQANDKLAESRTDMQDALYEHEIEQRKEALDKLKEEQDEYYDNLIKEIQDYLGNEVQLYKDACSMIDNDSGDLYGKLLWYCRNYTTTTEAEFNHMWNSAQSAMEQYNAANLGTFELLNNLQGRIYEVDGAIDAITQSISSYESAIDGVQSKLDDLSKQAQRTIADVKAAADAENDWAKTKWEYDWQGHTFGSFYEDKNAAIQDILHQIDTAGRFGGVFPASAATIYGMIRRKYASGTNYATGGLSLVGEKGAEFRVLNTGDGIVKNQIVKGITALGTNPAQFIADAGKLLMKNLFGGALSRSVEAIRSNNQIAPSIHINVQGDATQATVKAITAVANDIVNKATKNVMNLAVRNKRII